MKRLIATGLAVIAASLGINMAISAGAAPSQSIVRTAPVVLTYDLSSTVVGPVVNGNGGWVNVMLGTVPTTGTYDMTWMINTYDETSNDGAAVLLLRTDAQTTPVLVWEWSDVGSDGWSLLSGSKYVNLTAGQQLVAGYLNYANHDVTFSKWEIKPDYVQLVLAP